MGGGGGEGGVAGGGADGGGFPTSEVRLGGIPIGKVASFHLTPDFRAVVSMRMASGIALPKDTAVAIHTDGLFGGKYLELEPGGEDAILKDGDSIVYTQDAIIVTRLLDRIIAQGEARIEQQKSACSQQNGK